MRLGDVAEVRGGIAPSHKGDGAWYLQARGITSTGILPDAFAPGPLPVRTVEAAQLRSNDIVVGLRGERNVAALVSSELVEGQPRYVTLDLGLIRPDVHRIRAAFIRIFLNHPRTQAVLSRHRPAGVALARLPITALTELDLPALSLERQDTLIRLNAEAEEERQLMTRLIEARRTHTDQIFAEALRGEVEKPVPGCRPARAPSARDDHATVP